MDELDIEGIVLREEAKRLELVGAAVKDLVGGLGEGITTEQEAAALFISLVMREAGMALAQALGLLKMAKPLHPRIQQVIARIDTLLAPPGTDSFLCTTVAQMERKRQGGDDPQGNVV